MESNFRFLHSEYPILANLGILAERYIHDDPNTSLFKMRLFGEKMVETIIGIHQLDFLLKKSLFAKADQIEASYKKLKAKIEQLPQALLAKAFRGELVDQLPTDGDARDLLERIKLAKAGLEKGGKGKKLKVEDEVRMVAEEVVRYGKR